MTFDLRIFSRGEYVGTAYNLDHPWMHIHDAQLAGYVSAHDTA